MKVSKHRINKFTDTGGTANFFTVAVAIGLILGVVAFVLVLTRKCKPCKKSSGFRRENLTCLESSWNHDKGQCVDAHIPSL